MFKPPHLTVIFKMDIDKQIEKDCSSAGIPTERPNISNDHQMDVDLPDTSWANAIKIRPSSLNERMYVSWADELMSTSASIRNKRARTSAGIRKKRASTSAGTRMRKAITIDDMQIDQSYLIPIGFKDVETPTSLDLPSHSACYCMSEASFSTGKPRRRASTSSSILMCNMKRNASKKESTSVGTRMDTLRCSAGNEMLKRQCKCSSSE